MRERAPRRGLVVSSGRHGELAGTALEAGMTWGASVDDESYG